MRYIRFKYLSLMMDLILCIRLWSITTTSEFVCCTAWDLYCAMARIRSTSTFYRQTNALNPSSKMAW